MSNCDSFFLKSQKRFRMWLFFVWAIIQMSQGVEVLQHPQTLETNWITQPFHNYRSPPLVGLGKAASISNDSSSDDEEGFKPKTTTMVSLDLLTTEGQDTKYMSKDTLPSSITQMIASRSPSKDPRALITDCGAVKYGSKIKFFNCPGDIVVSSFAGSLKMTCREIESRDFFGLVYLRAFKCGQLIDFEWTCEATRALGILTSKCKSSVLGPLEIILIVALIASSLVCLLMMIFWCKLRSYMDKATHQFPMTTTKSAIEFTVLKHVNEEGEEVISDPRSTRPFNAVNENVRFSFLKLFLLMILCRPWPTYGYQVLNHLVIGETNHQYLVNIGEGEKIPIATDGIYREPVLHYSQLTLMFKTYDWKLEISQNYYCQWKSCDKLMSCRQGWMPFRNSTISINNFLGLNNELPSFSTCQRKEAMCSFGWGCIIIGFNVVKADTTEFGVYSVSKGGRTGGQVHVPAGCIAESYRMGEAIELEDHYLVTDGKERKYLCHKLLFSLRPEPGMLGDLQQREDGTTLFIQKDITCANDIQDSSICVTYRSFISELDSKCNKVSSLETSVKINKAITTVSWPVQGETEISVSCGRDLHISTTIIQCEQPTIKVWEVPHLHSEVALSFQGHSLNQGGVFKFPESVHMASHVFKCDGQIYLTSLYDKESLDATQLEYDHVQVPLEVIDDLQHDQFSDDKSLGPDGRWNLLSALRVALPGLTSFNIFLIVLVLIGIGCVRRG